MNKKLETVELVKHCTLMKVRGNKILDLRTDRCEGEKCIKCGWNEEVIRKQKEAAKNGRR